MLRWSIFVVLIAAAGTRGAETKEVNAYSDEQQRDMAPAGNGPKITKREAIILDNLPEEVPMYKRNVKVVYKKVPVRPKRYNSYALRKPKRNSKPYHRVQTKSLRQTKKSRRNQSKPKHLKKPHQISIINHPGRSPPFGSWRPQSSHPPHGTPHSNSFGEPPVKYSPESKYRKPSHSYMEVPYNSYTQDLHTGNADSEYFSGNLDDNYINPGHIGVATNYQPAKSNSQSDYFIDKGGKFERWPASTYANTDASYVRKPKTSKPNFKRTKYTTASSAQDEVLVGGQYAEPPGRYVKGQGSNPTIEDYEQVYSSRTASSDGEDIDVTGLTFYSDYLNDARRKT